VLLKVYNVSKEDIDRSISSILKYDNIVVSDKIIIIEALNLFTTKNLDFVDCILCIKSKKHEVKTFDKKLNKCIRTLKA
jgi:predicted nucleic-acid-binding protein